MNINEVFAEYGKLHLNFVEQQNILQQTNKQLAGATIEKDVLQKRLKLIESHLTGEQNIAIAAAEHEALKKAAAPSPAQPAPAAGQQAPNPSEPNQTGTDSASKAPGPALVPGQQPAQQAKTVKPKQTN